METEVLALFGAALAAHYLIIRAAVRSAVASVLAARDAASAYSGPAGEES